MYVITKVLKLEKGFKELYKTKLSEPFILQTVEGFVKREVLINERHKDYDILRISVYFSSRDAYIKWEGSDLHRSLHKSGEHQHHKPSPGVIEQSREAYHELVTLLSE